MVDGYFTFLVMLLGHPRLLYGSSNIIGNHITSNRPTLLVIWWRKISDNIKLPTFGYLVIFMLDNTNIHIVTFKYKIYYNYSTIY